MFAGLYHEAELIRRPELSLRSRALFAGLNYHEAEHGYLQAWTIIIEESLVEGVSYYQTYNCLLNNYVTFSVSRHMYCEHSKKICSLSWKVRAWARSKFTKFYDDVNLLYKKMRTFQDKELIFFEGSSQYICL